MSRGTAFQKAVLDALLADAEVAALVSGRIYDHRDPADAFPLITFGPAEVYDADADLLDAEDHVLQVDVWSRDGGRTWPCKDIVGAVKDALHRKALPAPEPYAVTAVRVLAARVIDDPDGLTAHGIVTVRARVEG